MIKPKQPDQSRSNKLNLTNRLLIAPPNMSDPRFDHSLIYIARHDHHGALGLVINQPIDVAINDVLHDLDIETTVNKRTPVLYGGPVRPDVGFVLHTGLPEWHSSVAVTENVCLTTSKDILQAIGQGQGVASYHICLGHAAWDHDQLEFELDRGDWFVVSSDAQLLFTLPYDQRYHAAAKKAGIDFARLSDAIGRA